MTIPIDIDDVPTEEIKMMEWLVDWYKSQCGKEAGCFCNWGDFYGIKIETIDNPGWHVQIDLAETDAAQKPFEAIERDRSDNDWIFCKVQDGKFDGVGDCTKLTEIIKIFQRFIQQ